MQFLLASAFQANHSPLTSFLHRDSSLSSDDTIIIITLYYLEFFFSEHQLQMEKVLPVKKGWLSLGSWQHNGMLFVLKVQF